MCNFQVVTLLGIINRLILLFGGSLIELLLILLGRVLFLVQPLSFFPLAFLIIVLWWLLLQRSPNGSFLSNFLIIGLSIQTSYQLWLGRGL